MCTPRTPVAIVSALLPFLLLSLSASSFAEGGTVGSVKTVSGTALVRRAGEDLPARPGLKLQAGDTLETAAGSSLGVILRDDSLISLGPSTVVAIEKFLFSPAEGKIGLTTRILRGTMAYLSGLIGRLAPESATFLTPAATIGIRGTHFAVSVAE